MDDTRIVPTRFGRLWMRVAGAGPTAAPWHRRDANEINPGRIVAGAGDVQR